MAVSSSPTWPTCSVIALQIGEFGFQSPQRQASLKAVICAADSSLLCYWEQDVVSCVEVAGWVEVDEVSVLVGNLLAQDVEVAGQVQLVGRGVSSRQIQSPCVASTQACAITARAKRMFQQYCERGRCCKNSLSPCATNVL